MAFSTPLWRFSQLFGDQSSLDVSDGNQIILNTFDKIIIFEKTIINIKKQFKQLKRMLFQQSSLMKLET